MFKQIFYLLFACFAQHHQCNKKTLCILYVNGFSMEIHVLLKLRFHASLSTAEVTIHSIAMENMKTLFCRLYPPIDKTRLRTSHKHYIIKLFSAPKYNVHVETFSIWFSPYILQTGLQTHMNSDSNLYPCSNNTQYV